jgi:hypothetical protein
MQSELRHALTSLLTTICPDDAFKSPVVFSSDYTVPYRQLATELHVGGVYVRLYLKQPTFRLTNPIFFTEKLVEFWEASFVTQVPLKVNKPIDEEDSRAVVLGKEDFLTLITSCLVCVIKGEPSVLDHLLSWEFVNTLSDSLKRALDMDRRGTPVISVIRLMHQFANHPDAVESLSSARNDVVLQLTRALNNNGNKIGAPPELPKEAAFIAELLKKMYQIAATSQITSMSSSLSHLVACGVKANLPNYLLDHVIGASKESLEGVRSPSSLKIYAVDILKAMVSAGEEYATLLRTLMDMHPSWADYRDQSHDLFITVYFILFLVS